MVTNPTQKTIARRVCLPPLSEFSMLADPCRRTCERNAMGHRLSKIVTRTGVERAARFACDVARKRKTRGSQGKLTCITKSNVMPSSDGLFQQIVE